MTTSAVSHGQVWYTKNSVDPITDEKEGLAGVRSEQSINYDHPYLLYACDNEGERIQIKTNEIHRENYSEIEKAEYGGMRIGNYAWIRIDGGDFVERSVRMFGEYKNAPTIVKGQTDPEFDALLQGLRDASKKIAVKTQQVTFTTRVTGSNSKIGQARRFCGLE